MKIMLSLLLVTLGIAGCAETDQRDAGRGKEGPSSAARAQQILKASPWWREYGITEVKDIGSDGIFVYTFADPGDELAATDICNSIRVLPNVVLIQVYDQNGDEIESERCGNVT